jgi:hypothetical protein
MTSFFCRGFFFFGLLKEYHFSCDYDNVKREKQTPLYFKDEPMNKNQVTLIVIYFFITIILGLSYQRQGI